MTSQDKKEYGRLYYLRNKARLIRQGKERYLRNRDAHLKTCRKWRSENPDKLKAAMKAWAQKNKDKVNAASRKYRKQNQEKRRITCKINRIKSRDQRREYNRKWTLLNHEHVLKRRRILRQKNFRQYREAGKRQRKANPHKYREAVRRRRAIMANCTVENCSTAVKKLLSSRNCYWCWTEFDLINRPEIEHVVPINRGGQHAPNNLVASCASCNRSKSDRLYWEWDGDLAA